MHASVNLFFIYQPIKYQLLSFEEQQITQEKVLEILPMVSEVNAVSDELNKHKSFEVVLMPSLAICGRVDDQKSVK